VTVPAEFEFRSEFRRNGNYNLAGTSAKFPFPRNSRNHPDSGGFHLEYVGDCKELALKIPITSISPCIQYIILILLFGQVDSLSLLSIHLVENFQATLGISNMLRVVGLPIYHFLHHPTMTSPMAPPLHTPSATLQPPRWQALDM